MRPFIPNMPLLYVGLFDGLISKTLFFNIFLEEEAYHQSDCWSVHGHWLRRSLYGSNRSLDLGFLISLPFYISLALRDHDYMMLLLIYVDDIVLIYSPYATFASLLASSNNEFAIKDLAPPCTILVVLRWSTKVNLFQIPHDTGELSAPYSTR